MRIEYNLRGKSGKKDALLTIGIFDGVHLGHLKILRALIRKARREKKEAHVLTFSPHPSKVLHPKMAPPMLLSLEHRLKVLDDLGIDTVFVIRFDKHFACLSADGFVRHVLVDRLRVGEIFIGENFNLGHRRKGTVGVLEKLAAKYGFKMNVIECKKIGNRPVSSTLIRKFVIAGKLREASRLLGRRFSILGTVVHGDKRGHIIGFPTANLDLHHEAIPPAGVYAVFVKVDMKVYPGILNIGFRPTFKSNKTDKTVEAHIFGFHKKIYGRDLEVIFIRKIRDERHFKNRDHLKQRIGRDIVFAKGILRRFT